MCSNSNRRAVKMLEEIKAKRESMIHCASQNGFTNEMTIKLSQELDELINEYQRTFRSHKESENAGKTFVKMVKVMPGKKLVEI
ncbi:aspartyl-phosphate phosphatase Spo0E family protein [Neobacillus sp. SM06]|uniref:aspartyl-phosphate phosphatase Spo0E family protein n=1 Tax=Neobacillus sp. SM06 TaxID=3422492 RepID=UPI003D2672FA